jgi:hypothetical protein
MAVIRHVCAGHEYRYDTDTGDVRNNYGRTVSHLRICKMTGYALLYGHTAHWPAIYADQDKPVASARDGHTATDDALARFAIGHTAVNFPED